LIDKTKTTGLPSPAAGATPKATPRWLEAIRAAASEGVTSTLSPLSAVLLVIEATGLLSRVAKWDEPIRRQSHIDAMIRVARGFEEAGLAAGRAPTVAEFAATYADRADDSRRRTWRTRDDVSRHEGTRIPGDHPC